MRPARILATTGPASSDRRVLAAMIEAGADAFRCNLSVSTPEDHRARIALIAEVAHAVGRPVAIFADLQGAKLRAVGIGADGLTLGNGDEQSNPANLFVDYAHVAAEVPVGVAVRMHDGEVALRVVAREPGALVCRVERGGRVGARTGVSIPEADLALPALHPGDLVALSALDLSLVDEVGLSYAGSAADVERLRRELAVRDATCRVVAKIERAQALRHLAEIVGAADSVLVARGDLGAELGLFEVPAAQRAICREARAQGRPIVLATHLLESMVRGQGPTRAEVNDIANAIWDGVTTLCVTAETALGHSPVEVVRTLAAIADAAASHPTLFRAP
jgi:pyruvate kinase